MDILWVISNKLVIVLKYGYQGPHNVARTILGLGTLRGVTYTSFYTAYRCNFSLLDSCTRCECIILWMDMDPFNFCLVDSKKSEDVYKGAPPIDMR